MLTRLRKPVVLLFCLLFAFPVVAQTSDAAQEARIRAMMELRFAEAMEEMRAEQEATRLAMVQAIHALQAGGAVDRRALTQIAAGDVAVGISSLERQARTRDVRVTAGADAAARRVRSEEWRHIGALAFLDNTDRAIQAYENARRFTPDDPEVLDQLAWLYGRKGDIAERRSVAQQMAQSADSQMRMRGLVHLGDIHLDANDGEAARPYIDQALTLANEGNATRQQAMLWAFLGASELLERNFRNAERAFVRSLEISRANGLRDVEAMALFGQGTMSFSRGASSLVGRQGHFQRAELAYDQVQSIFVDENDEISVAQILIRRGHVARLMDNLPLSEQRLRDALAILDRLDVRARYGFAQQQLGTTLSEQRRYDEAIPLFGSAVAIARQTAQPVYEGSALYDWANAEWQRGNHAEGCRLTREAAAAFARAPGQERQSGAVRMLASVRCA